MKFQDKVAIITGSTKGIGKATAKLLAAEGAKVVIVGTTEEAGTAAAEEIRAGGGEAFFRKTDVTSGEDLDGLVQDTLGKYGRIDILVNNAGIGGSLANMDQITMEEWDKVLATNLTAPFQIMKRVIPVMEQAGGGAIVNVASMASTAAGRGGIAYTSAKHGLLGLTRQVSLDHGHAGIRVNAVLPGPIDTQMIARVLAMPQHPLNMKIKMSPAGRPGQPEEVAQAIAWLLSEKAPSHMRLSHSVARAARWPAGRGGEGHRVPGLRRLLLHTGRGAGGGRRLHHLLTAGPPAF